METIFRKYPNLNIAFIDGNRRTVTAPNLRYAFIDLTHGEWRQCVTCVKTKEGRKNICTMQAADEQP